MRVSTYLLLTLLAAGLTTAAQAVPPRDAQGCRDTSLFTRMPHYYISRCEEEEFVEEKITTPQGPVTVKGRKSVLHYKVTPGAAGASSAEVVGNYENAIKKVGGKVTWSSRFHAHMQLETGGVKSWIKLSALNPRDYSLTIIEERKMQQKVQADADAWLRDIVATGRAAVYGIYFDTGKAVVKPESQPTLAEMAKLLKTHPTLKVYIVGHTDSTGSYGANVQLSRQRATSVVRALVSKYGVPTSRLKAAGVGPLSPAASNRGEAGRAKNRRVELVEQ